MEQMQTWIAATADRRRIVLAGTIQRAEARYEHEEAQLEGRGAAAAEPPPRLLSAAGSGEMAAGVRVQCWAIGRVGVPDLEILREEGSGRQTAIILRSLWARRKSRDGGLVSWALSF